MTEERIVERIRKMLALANDLAATEAERETALRMAYNLLAKYNLELSDVEKKAESERRMDNANTCFGMPWAKQASMAIAELFFCNYYIGAKVNGTQVVHHFVGKESNAVTAAFMADWIVKSILKEGRRLYKHNLSPETRAFASGAVQRLRERIREMREQAEAENTGGTAMVLADVYQMEVAANERWMEEQGIRLVTRKTRHKACNADAFDTGRRFGDKINLNRQVGKAPAGHLE